MPHTETFRALIVHFRNWVMRNTPPPDEPLSDAARGRARRADAKRRWAFRRFPACARRRPKPGFINPVLDYDWGPQFDHDRRARAFRRNAPPPIKQVIRTLVPRVNADGNEVGGVPVVLLEAPLGTYLGWNITADGFHKDKLCTYAGGMIPFARTRAERMANGDPRLSLEERYRDHAGYVAAVRKAAASIVATGFLLKNPSN